MDKILSRLAQAPYKELVAEPKMILDVPLEHFELMVNALHSSNSQEWIEENANEYDLMLFEYIRDLNEKVMLQTRDLSTPHLKRLIKQAFVDSGMNPDEEIHAREYQDVCDIAVKNLHKFRSSDVTVGIFIEPNLVENYLRKCWDHYGKQKMEQFLFSKGILKEGA